MTEHTKLTVKLASPRGFCAGVERAILIVEEALKLYGPPVYVRHEIVHNIHVVKRLEKMGVIFIDELHEITQKAPVIFSAHGVPKSVPDYAAQHDITYIDATCPLVSKVHREVEYYAHSGYYIILIGHKNHPEVVGTMGQIDANNISLVETINDVSKLNIPTNKDIAYVTQTTLSVDDTHEIIEALKAKFPNIHQPKKEDICYATTNRQLAVKEISKNSDLLLVVGSKNSSNSQRLVEVGKYAGVKNAYLIDDDTQIDMAWFHGVNVVSLSAGASAPEYLVENTISKLANNFSITIDNINVAKETTHFKLPKMPAMHN